MKDEYDNKSMGLGKDQVYVEMKLAHLYVLLIRQTNKKYFFGKKDEYIHLFIFVFYECYYTYIHF